MVSLVGKIICVIACLYCFSSCYDDLGNYDYKEIDDISVSLPLVVRVKLPKVGAVLCEVVPDIEQTKGTDESHLKFRWRKKTENITRPWDDISTERNLKMWVNANETQRVTMRFEVTDTLTGFSAIAVVQIWKVKPFFATWFILQDIDGQSQLGCVDLSGSEAVVSTDIRRETMENSVDNAGEKIEGAPRFMIGYPNYGKGPVLEVFTDQGGYMIDGTKLNVVFNYNQLLFLDQNKDVVINPQFAKADRAEVIINDGQFWYAEGDGSSVFYPIGLSESAGTSYHATHAVASYISGGAFVYDSEGHRFLSYKAPKPLVETSLNASIRGGAINLYNPSKRAKLSKLTAAYNNPNKFDPDNVNVDRLLYMGTNNSGAILTLTNVVAVGVDKEGKCCIYELCFDSWYNGNGTVCSGYWEYTPEVHPDKWSVATSYAFDRVFFYAADNKIYRVNFINSTPKEYLIYTHEDAGAVLSNLKFQSETYQTIKDYVNTSEPTMNTQPRQLGASIKYSDGREGILLIKLGKNGTVEKETEGEEKPVREFSGFKNIKDIGYSFQLPF